MSHIWTFSASSQQLLKRCITAARPNEDDEKWIKRFKAKEENLIEKSENSEKYSNDDVIQVCDSDNEAPEVENKDVLDLENYTEVIDTIVLEPVTKFEFLVEESLKNPQLLTIMAENLTNNCIEKICSHVFGKKDVNTNFLDSFYVIFFPALLKRDTSWFCLDLLVKAEKANSALFEKLICVILKDLKISNMILQEYANTLSITEKNYFLNIILRIDFSKEEFLHNLFTILTVYKDSKKNENLQKKVENFLIKFSEFCNNEKNFGRFLLAFLQEEKSLGKKDCKLKNAVEMHRTPFQKPCLNILRDLSN